jgi:hypothetical protein
MIPWWGGSGSEVCVLVDCIRLCRVDYIVADSAGKCATTVVVIVVTLSQARRTPSDE